MKILKIIFAMLFAFSMIYADMLVRVPLNNKQDLDFIYKNKLSIVDKTEHSVTLYIKNNQYNLLKARGFQIEVLIPDIQRYVEERIKPQTKLDTSLTMHYHDYNQIIYLMDSVAAAHPNIVKLDTIGYSVQGRLLLAAKVSDNPDIKEDEAEVRIVGCHHGNEWPSAEIPLFLLAYLSENYGTDAYITQLINNREIWILPMVNPDGHEAHTRENANGIDLNRNYGYMWTGAGGDTEPYGQPETDAMYRWSQRENFTMGLTYHTYHPAVNYIWNYSPDHIPDSALIVTYAQIYGDSTAANGDPYWVTEGYAWYQTYGDLNDYSMGIDGINDVTIELCHEFVPPETQLDTTWRINRGAILAFIQKAGQGIHGYVIDSTTSDTIKEAVIYSVERDWPVFTDRETGDYFLPTLPGTYTIKVWANGYNVKTISGITVQEDSAIKLDVYLTPGGGYYIYKLVAAHIDTESTPVIKPHIPSILGAPDGDFVSLNGHGWVIVDMGETTPVTGAFTVYEGDDGYPNESFKVYGSNSYKGPWTYIGEGSGTTTFNITGTGLTTARYLKIEDTGNNPSQNAIAGFDLDAVENLRQDAPIVAFAGDSIIDTSGIINGQFDPGDLGYLKLTYANYGTRTAYNLKVFATSTSSYLTISSDTVTIDSIAPSHSVSVSRDFSVSPATPVETHVTVVVTAQYDTITLIDSLHYVIGAKDSTWFIGPDGYGYYAYDRLDTLYTEWENISFRDIQGVGTPLNLADDEVSRIALPFTFKYYGTEYDSVYISSNGWLSFIAPNNAYYQNDQIPAAGGPTGVIAPLWDDLDPSSAGNVYYYSDATNHEFIIEWAGVPRYGTNEFLTFEAILRDPASYTTITGDGEIVFSYQRLDNTSSATVGIESPDESTGIEYLYNANYHEQAAVLVPDGFIKFTTDTPHVGVEEAHIRKNLYFYMPTIFSGKGFTFTITLPEAQKLVVKVYDITGRVVLTRKIQTRAGFNRININNIHRKGILFVEVKGKSWVKREKIMLF